MFSEELQQAKRNESLARDRFNSANAELVAANGELERAEAIYSEKPTDSNWKAVESARARVDRASVAHRHAEGNAGALASTLATLEQAEAAERQRIERERGSATLRQTLQARHDVLNGRGFYEPLRKVRDALTLLVEGVTEAHDELARLQTERSELEEEARSLGVLVPDWEYLPEFHEFEVEIRTMVFEATCGQKFDNFEFARVFRIPVQQIESTRRIFVAARAYREAKVRR